MASCLTATKLKELEDNVSYHFDQAINSPVSKTDIAACQFGLVKIIFGSVLGASLGAFNGVRSLSLVKSGFGKMAMLVTNTLGGSYLGFILGANYSISHFGFEPPTLESVEPSLDFNSKFHDFIKARFELRRAKGLNYLLNGVQKEISGIDEEEIQLRRELNSVDLPSHFHNLRPVSGKKLVESLRDPKNTNNNKS